MKLPIKKKYFDLIKEGKKEFEYRDAHITFVCEETGETLRKEIIGCGRISKEFLSATRRMSDEEINAIFEDDMLIYFNLK